MEKQSTVKPKGAPLTVNGNGSPAVTYIFDQLRVITGTLFTLKERIKENSEWLHVINRRIKIIESKLIPDVEEDLEEESFDEESFDEEYYDRSELHSKLQDILYELEGRVKKIPPNKGGC